MTSRARKPDVTLAQPPCPVRGSGSIVNTTESLGHPAFEKRLTLQFNRVYERRKSVEAPSARLVQGAPVVSSKPMVKRSEPSQVFVPARVRKRSVMPATTGVVIWRMAVEAKDNMVRSLIIPGKQTNDLRLTMKRYMTY